MENLAEALKLLFHWQNIFGMFFGVILGQWMGALPGLTSSMAIAVLIPLTYFMPTWAAIIMLVGIYKGALFADSTAAILIKTPGMPAAAAVMIDGYPLAQQGKAGKALKMALYASVCGNMFADLCLIFCSAGLALFALQFGPSEFTTLILFSMTVVAGVSGRSFLKGIIAASFGTLLATVGSGPMSGSLRFTFGRIELIDGLPLIPVLIGLLAISEVLKQLEYSNKQLALTQIKKKISSKEDNRVSWTEFKNCGASILRGSVIGTIIGALPGLGATVATFLAYNETKRTSKHPEKFGKGALEGVAATDAASSAVAGSNMIPLLAFGIPGDLVAAILLGAFLIHGITPGPLIFIENTVTIYAIFLGLILANFVNLFTGQFFIMMAVKVLSIPKRILYPSIITIAVIGSYSFNGSLFDVKIMFIFGVLGYFMTKYGFSTISFLIGFILGPILEDWVRRSLIISDNNISIFFSSPLSLFFIVLTVVVTYLLIKQRGSLLKLENENGMGTNTNTAD